MQIDEPMWLLISYFIAGHDYCASTRSPLHAEGCSSKHPVIFFHQALGCDLGVHKLWLGLQTLRNMYDNNSLRLLPCQYPCQASYLVDFYTDHKPRWQYPCQQTQFLTLLFQVTSLCSDVQVLIIVYSAMDIILMTSFKCFRKIFAL